jgi:hypothetical protein
MGPQQEGKLRAHRHGSCFARCAVFQLASLAVVVVVGSFAPGVRRGILVVEALPGLCLRRRHGTRPSVAAAFRARWLLRDIYAATCQGRRRPGQARRGQGLLQITAVLSGRMGRSASHLWRAERAGLGEVICLGFGEDIRSCQLACMRRAFGCCLRRRVLQPGAGGSSPGNMIGLIR